jgi:hypothetical protein
MLAKLLALIDALIGNKYSQPPMRRHKPSLKTVITGQGFRFLKARPSFCIL